MSFPASSAGASTERCSPSMFEYSRRGRGKDSATPSIGFIQKRNECIEVKQIEKNHGVSRLRTKESTCQKNSPPPYSCSEVEI